MTQKTKYEIFFFTSSLPYERQLIIYAINRRSMTIYHIQKKNNNGRIHAPFRKIQKKKNKKLNIKYRIEYLHKHMYTHTYIHIMLWHKRKYTVL